MSLLIIRVTPWNQNYIGSRNNTFPNESEMTTWDRCNWHWPFRSPESPRVVMKFLGHILFACLINLLLRGEQKQTHAQGRLIGGCQQISKKYPAYAFFMPLAFKTNKKINKKIAKKLELNENIQKRENLSSYFLLFKCSTVAEQLGNSFTDVVKHFPGI